MSCKLALRTTTDKRQPISSVTICRFTPQSLAQPSASKCASRTSPKPYSLSLARWITLGCFSSQLSWCPPKKSSYFFVAFCYNAHTGVSTHIVTKMGNANLPCLPYLLLSIILMFRWIILQVRLMCLRLLVKVCDSVKIVKVNSFVISTVPTPKNCLTISRRAAD